MSGSAHVTRVSYEKNLKINEMIVDELLRYRLEAKKRNLCN